MVAHRNESRSRVPGDGNCRLWMGENDKNLQLVPEVQCLVHNLHRTAEVVEGRLCNHRIDTLRRDRDLHCGARSYHFDGHGRDDKNHPFLGGMQAVEEVIH
jgi:hypothetical protein